MRRMWINQPSTRDPLHKLHGINVLAKNGTDRCDRVYFLSGDAISQFVPKQCLSSGWVKHV